jgi:hypothetical protein
MIDFGGWASNWEWSGYAYGERPTWSAYLLTIPAFVSLCCIALSLVGVGEEALWLAGAVGAAFVIEIVSRDGIDDKLLLYASYSLSTVFAGLSALAALRMSDDAVRLDFALAAPCLMFAFGPATSRAFAATLFSLRMVRHAKEQRALASASLSGDADALVVRVESVDGENVVLTTLGEASGQTLVATREVLEIRYGPSKGTHYLLEVPSFGDTETNGYRGESAQRRVLATKDSHYLGWKAEPLSPSHYWDEVRAGIVFVLVEHSILSGIAWFLAHWIR